MATSPPQLFLLADHIKLALLERQRAVSLGLSPHSQDAQLARSLAQLRAGIASLESQTADTADESVTSQLPRLRSQLDDLGSQFSANTTAAAAAAQKNPRPPTKSVRFSDHPADARDAQEAADRAQLFPYRDDPDPHAAPDHAALDNQQIHEYHAQVIRDQDDQLGQLGASIGRQRELSMQIGDELDGHVVLLDEVDEGVDRHTAQFRRARGRLDRFSRKARENWSLTVIVVLICILLLLIVITK
ncbi:hypothetical protein BDU57DRAFT_518090 [Ampelomyces quisqualis]|uniref:t-SNARE coiled-coil homology domain-containing protein n=1 Tax=Ampelomyces quisqualis TaxID=50730 RepID=A0A6A5QII9_AMPQU|nr:hypothetical protein BDU57DRAFT_518090 [Ampelomyces quisqualis]